MLEPQYCAGTQAIQSLSKGSFFHPLLSDLQGETFKKRQIACVFLYFIKMSLNLKTFYMY